MSNRTYPKPRCLIICRTVLKIRLKEERIRTRLRDQTEFANLTSLNPLNSLKTLNAGKNREKATSQLLFK
ncbi:MAG: hypothetical protein ACOX7X_10810 [Methanosarcina flavescens]|uniref:Uncharacterized protein n=1 Tax=Methanosarcina thermophila (strain ATCC 43570 / DSM 1825 / OCM 12 / VKM B-1830 / TM-1) TaxID=523844 RepID=A0A0E3N964_METTT|nr:hypothetical protein [Methanosarcina thermophila]AKB13145.1 hypothetical protein MSTHT_1387 [Methanosarcina thermophila TM-1]HOA69989.1 hypothetical protein [Methanosarcina thermophila]HOQ64349.1 hypothetical protein [Methanosarcina thermophila]HPT79579.1 hypothetical protein [Methanosarcina thermophila]HPZ21173.1 hypothetical protein [Methanosarcina thermophila]